MNNTPNINIQSLIGIDISKFNTVFKTANIDCESIFAKIDSDQNGQLVESEILTQKNLIEQIFQELEDKTQDSGTTESTPSGNDDASGNDSSNASVNSSQNGSNPASSTDLTSLNDKYTGKGKLNASGTDNVNTPFYKDAVRKSSASYIDKINSAGLTGEINFKGDGYNPQSGEDVASLTEKKQTTAAKYDNEIKTKENEKSSIVEKNTAITTELKTQYTSTQSEITATESEISQLDNTISSLDTKIANFENSATKLSAEMSGINSNQDVSLLNNSSISNETKTKVQASREKRKNNIQNALNEIKNNIEQANTAKTQAETQKKEKETAKKVLEQTLAEIEKKMPDDLQSQISNITNEIQNLKTQKISEISQIDSEISKAKETEKSKAQFEGEQEGQKTEVTKRALEIATNEETIGYFNNKESEWCVKYASFCYSAAMNEFGIETPLSDKSKGIINLGNAANAEITDNSTLKAGDIIVVGDTKAGDVLGHTGMILEVYPDGSVRTLEGNKDGGKVSSYYLTKEELDKNYYYRYDAADMVECNAAVEGK